jgi:hypothetical protein
MDVQLSNEWSLEIVSWVSGDRSPGLHLPNGENEIHLLERCSRLVARGRRSERGDCGQLLISSGGGGVLRV